MGVRILTEADVRTLLPMDECVDAMAEVFRTLSRGDALQPLRSLMRIPDKSGLLGLMPAYLGEPRSMGIKVVSVMPGNHGTKYDAHQGVVLLFEAVHGCLLAVMDASSITQIRTGAASGLATRLLSREDAGDLAILGSGVQAVSHLEAMRTVRRLRRVRVWSRNAEHARHFAAHESARTGLRVETVASAREAVEGADLVCTTTSSRTPVLEGAWLAEGAHVNAAGACFPDTRELDTEAMRRARLYTDRRESLMNEAGEFLIPRAEGAITDGHVRGEIGELMAGKVQGRESPRDVTLFKSLGLAIEDLAAANHIHRAAVARNVGIEVELGGLRAE